MKHISLMELRHHLGAVLDEVRITSEPVVLERSGRAIAMICPMGHMSGDAEGGARKREALSGLLGQGRAAARDEDLSEWLKKLRSRS